MNEELAYLLCQCLAKEVDRDLSSKPFYLRFLSKKEQKKANKMIDDYNKIPKEERIKKIIEYYNQYEN